MNNSKIIMISSIVGAVIVALVLGTVREKREERDAKMTKDSMNQVTDMFKDTFKEVDFTK